MTREEAIQVLQTALTAPFIYGEYAEAIDMAIEALSADAEKPNMKSWNGLYIKVYADDDPQDKAEKLYQICDSNEALSEVAKCIQGYCDIPSAEAVQGWIPFTRRPMTEEEQKDYPNCTFIFDCVLPDDGDEILVSNGRFVWMDEFCDDIDGCYLDGGDDIDEDMAWMPLPEPYKGGENK